MATAAATSSTRRRPAAGAPVATQSARVTVLMTPDKKAQVEADAAKLGVSSGEYIRLAVDNFDSAEQEELLRAAIDEVNAAVPRMIASLDHSIALMEATHLEVDAVLRKLGIRT